MYFPDAPYAPGMSTTLDAEVGIDYSTLPHYMF